MRTLNHEKMFSTQKIESLGNFWYTGVVALTPDPRPPVGADRRASLLATLQQSPEPLTIDVLATRLDVKPSTIRGDLDVLLATGEIERQPLAGPGRGRPKWVYRAALPTASPYEVLARALAHHMTGGPTPPEVMAQEWLDRIPQHEPAASPDEAVLQAGRSLEALGFTVAINPKGDELTMTKCPYADLVDEFPMICEIHGALLSGILRESDQGVDIESIDVWARDDMCIAHLRRDDLRPGRTIRSSDLAALTPGKEAHL